MSPKRLRIYDADAPRALHGVPAPMRSAGRAYTLVQVLEIVLDTAGLSLGYEAVMGLCGLAYRTPPWPEEPALSRGEAISAAEALGAALCAGIVIVEAGDDLSPDAVIEQVEKSVAAGRPCAALGWGSVKEHWSIICGTDRGRGRLLGHCVLDGTREQYESWPASVEVLVTLPAPPVPSGREAIDRALSSGCRRLFGEAPARYARWAQRLREIEAPSSRGHEEAVEMLADARTAAATFAESVALHENELRAAWLTEAAGLWSELVDLLDSRGASYTPEAMAWLETAQGREAWAGMLERAAHLDERAAGAVKCSTTADYLPREAQGP